MKWMNIIHKLRRNVTIETSAAALYLCRTCERRRHWRVHHVDAGYHVVGHEGRGRARHRDGLMAAPVARRSRRTAASMASSYRQWNSSPGRCAGVSGWIHNARDGRFGARPGPEEAVGRLIEAHAPRLTAGADAIDSPSRTPSRMTSSFSVRLLNGELP